MALVAVVLKWNFVGPRQCVVVTASQVLGIVVVLDPTVTVAGERLSEHVIV